MPAYEYQCTGCGAFSTLMKSMEKATQPETCELCEQPLQRVYSVPAVDIKNGTPKFHRRRPA